MEKKLRITTIGSHNCYNISMLFLVIIILIALGGCAGFRTHITLLNKDLVVTEPPPTGEIKFLQKFPSRNYEVLGKIYADALQVIDRAPDLATIDELIIKKANIIGADAVVHMHYGTKEFFVGGKWMSWGSGLAIKYIENKAKSTSLDFVVIVEEHVVEEIIGKNRILVSTVRNEVNERIMREASTNQYSLEAHGYYAVVKSSEKDIYMDLKRNGDINLELLSVVQVIPKEIEVVTPSEMVVSMRYSLEWSYSLVDSSRNSLWESSDGFDSLKPIFDIEDSENLRLDPMVRD